MLYEKIFFQEKYPNTCTSSSTVRNCRRGNLPGSRNAPLAIHFSEVDSFNCFSIVDERSAAFVAMGMAKSEKKPVAVTCTSGSAVVNYYPAITEAFYQNIPLLVLTADRPTDFVDIFDGQTIRQKDVFHQHSYGDFQLLEDTKEHAEEINFDTIKKQSSFVLKNKGRYISIYLWKNHFMNWFLSFPLFLRLKKPSGIKSMKFLPI